MNALKYILVVFFLSAHFAAFSQDESGLKELSRAKDFKLQERVLLIFDQDFYLAGETLNFFAVTLDAALQIPITFSSILYIELYNQDNKVLTTKKVLLKNGEATNTLALPREINTGYYYIRAYTNFMKNFGPSTFFIKRLKIVNPFVPNAVSLIDTLSDNNNIAAKAAQDPEQLFGYNKPRAGLVINAHLNKTEANRGDTITLDIDSSNTDSIQYVLALHLGNKLTLPSLQENIASTLKSLSYSHLTYLPEFTTDIVTGRVNAGNSNVSTANKILYLSFVDSVSWTTRCRTDTLGRFTATLPIEYQGDDLVVSMVDTTNSFSIVFDDEFSPYFLEVNKEDYYPNPSLKPIIEARMLNLQVNDAYDEPTESSISAERPLLRFYGYPDNEYIINTYTDLPNLEEFIREVVLEAYVRKKRAQTSIMVKTEKTNNKSPLIILDGIPLFQADHLLPLISTEKLKSVRVVASRFFFGSEIYEGILDITSNDKALSLVEKDKNSVRIRFSPVTTTPANNKLMNLRTPHYTSDLYFDSINSAKGKESIRIALPQNAGLYSLTLFGYTKNGEWDYRVLPDILNVK